MLELLTGTGLAVAAGLNAYIPLLIVGLGGRFLDFVELPAAGPGSRTSGCSASSACCC